MAWWWLSRIKHGFLRKIGVAGTSNSPSQIWRILPVSPSCSRPSLGSRSRVPCERRTFRLREAGKPLVFRNPHGPCNGSKAIRWVCFCRWAKKPPQARKSMFESMRRKTCGWWMPHGWISSTLSSPSGGTHVSSRYQPSPLINWSGCMPITMSSSSEISRRESGG